MMDAVAAVWQRWLIGDIHVPIQGREAPVQRLADSVAGHFCYTVMAASATTFGFWYLLGEHFHAAFAQPQSRWFDPLLSADFATFSFFISTSFCCTYRASGVSRRGGHGSGRCAAAGGAAGCGCAGGGLPLRPGPCHPYSRAYPEMA